MAGKAETVGAGSVHLRDKTVSAEEIAQQALALWEELLEWAEFLGLNTAEYRDEYTRLATAYMAKTGREIS